MDLPLPTDLLLGVGSVGILGMSFAFPILGRLFFRRSKGAKEWAPSLSTGLEILIPAHNEEKTLPFTLKSIERAVSFFQRQYPGFKAKLRVGADACTDATSEIAQRGGALVLERPKNGGKWRTLCELSRESQSDEAGERPDWIVLVDAGALWPEDLLTQLDSTRNSAHWAQVAALAPAYAPKNCSSLEKAHWRIERFFKSLENRWANGPISVHGASVFYRREALATAFQSLEKISKGSKIKDWLNDDVALPLMIHLLSTPKRRLRIEYCKEALIADAGLIDHSTLAETTRRQRISQGNAQWARNLLPIAFKNDRLTALIALRRFFRWFWAWWISAFGLGCLQAAGFSWRMTGIIYVFALALSALVIPKVLAAALASFYAPIALLKSANAPLKNWS